MKIIKFLKNLWKKFDRYCDKVGKAECEYRKWCIKNGMPYDDPFNPCGQNWDL